MSTVTSISSRCSKLYYPSVHHSGARGLHEIYWIVLHDEEAPTAEAAAGYFLQNSSGGSAHLCVDDKICYRCLPDDLIPWGAASAIGANTHGFHIEMAGYAKWTPKGWMMHKRTIDRAAYKAALHCLKFDIPVRWVNRNGLLRGEKGITTHKEITYASKKADPGDAYKYTHTDPGLFFPRRYFMRRCRKHYARLRHTR